MQSPPFPVGIFRKPIASFKQILRQSVAFLYQITSIFSGFRSFVPVLFYTALSNHDCLFCLFRGFLLVFVLFLCCICVVFVLYLCLCGARDGVVG